jgi:hypothetical protein
MMSAPDRIAEFREYAFPRCLITIFILSIVLLRMDGYGQDSTKVVSDSTDIRIYIDSPDYGTDLDYFRTEITFVNYVRDRADADVHILTTTQATGAGGTEFTIAFIGLRKFEGQKNSLKFATKPDETADNTRKELARYYKIGLMPFVSQSEAVQRIDITYQKSGDGANSKTVKDPWNYWAFRADVNGGLNGETAYDYRSISSSFSADRVTDAWKLHLGLQLYHTRTKYDYGDSLSYTDNQRTNYGGGSAVKSLTPHWSAGVRCGAYKSSYSNIDLSLSCSPGIEFNVFPYSESTRKQFTFQYLVEASHYNFHEETIYLKTSERRFEESLNITYTAKQPWGSIGSSIYSSHFLDDMKKYSVQWFNSIDLRLIKGFSLNCSGYMTFLRNQISLPRRGASIEEILLRRRQLQTTYYYYLSMGFSYTFGSIYNNIVNPRLGGF